MSEIKLTPTSYIVLGLLQSGEPATPYDLKGRVAAGVGNFWSLQHTQLYTEPERLAEAGYLIEEQEHGGRRRKRYTLAPRGHEALAQWLGQPSAQLPELRDIGLLQLFFGAEPRALAEVQVVAHEEKLREYKELEQLLIEAGPDAATDGQRAALRAGIGHEREWIRHWSALKAG